MIDNLESSYDCSNAGADLHALKEELREMQASSQGRQPTLEEQEQYNRLINQISFIENKCSIPPKG
ncbi:DUF2524 domain-containing protein [Paenibacillus chartarius]|uniref:DUF2524 domain-containing protein n=1 Tax=Paenibacillus chartarius TaxID=747481 RepID=A0ABV6DI81_9BACL